MHAGAFLRALGRKHQQPDVAQPWSSARGCPSGFPGKTRSNGLGVCPDEQGWAEPAAMPLFPAQLGISVPAAPELRLARSCCWGKAERGQRGGPENGGQISAASCPVGFLTPRGV